MVLDVGKRIDSDSQGPNSRASLDSPLHPRPSFDSPLHASPSMPLDLIAGSLDSLEAVQSDVAYRGLSVRMMIVTGKAEKVAFHRITRRREYEGEVRCLKICFQST